MQLFLSPVGLPSLLTLKQDHFYCGQFYAHNQNLQTEAQVLSNFYSGQFYVHNQNLQTEDQILSNFYPGQFYVHNQKKQTEAQILSPALYIDSENCKLSCL